MFKPELLAPAGNLEKLKIAYAFGADAAYAGGTSLSLRMSSGNLTLYELEKAVSHANELGKKLYLVVNIMAHQSETKLIVEHLKKINKIKPHGLVISDAGILNAAQDYTDIPCHISTQSSVTNKYAIRFYKDSGAKRIVLARELSLKEIELLSNEKIELEVFIHGAMCISYSGKCIISNHYAGRDANRGGCVQNCRYKYNLNGEKSYIMSSKDLMTVKLLTEFIKIGVHSLKIEGRMKSNMYLANTVSVYRSALDFSFNCLQKNIKIPEKKIISWEKELSKVSNRTFTTGNFLKRAGKESIRKKNGNYEKKIEYLGTVLDVSKKGIAIESKASFNKGETIEFHTPDGFKVKKIINKMLNPLGLEISKTRPNSIVILPFTKKIKKYSIVRRI